MLRSSFSAYDPKRTCCVSCCSYHECYAALTWTAAHAGEFGADSCVGYFAAGSEVYSTNTPTCPELTTKSRKRRSWFSKLPTIHTPPWTKNKIPAYHSD